MKKLFYILAIGLVTLTACTGVKTVTKGLENEAFIELIGNSKNYSGGVEVSIDESVMFIAEVNEINMKRPKGTVYAISTGKHIVTLKYNNEVIYSKQIFVSAQETKQIVLP